MRLRDLDIYFYLDYREYLGEYYKKAKKASSHFSFRQFSNRVGVKASNFLQWLIEGKRNLSKSTIPRVTKALGLNDQESEYFQYLVLFSQANTIKEKTEYFHMLSSLRRPVDHKRVTETQYEHYRNWYNNAIRELLKFYNFQEDEKWAFRKLAKMLAPAISESQAKRAIDQLIELGMAKKDTNNRVKQTEAVITTGDEVKSFFVRKFHESMIALAKESIDRFPREYRDVSSLTMSVSDECANLIKKEIQQFRKRIMEMVKLDKSPNQVRQLNFQFFPLTNIKKVKKFNAKK
jgi:uncharacterized protein (TIGR02147 family)